MQLIKQSYASNNETVTLWHDSAIMRCYIVQIKSIMGELLARVSGDSLADVEAIFNDWAR